MSTQLLVIQNNAEDAAFIRKVLSTVNPDMDIEVVPDGREALDYLFGTGRFSTRDTARMPQLILLDLSLPVLPGFHALDVLRVAKSYTRTRIIPIVILAETDQFDMMFESYQFSANSYIEKSDDKKLFRHALELVGRYWLMVNKAATARPYVTSSFQSSTQSSSGKINQVAHQ
jgi:two-component system response regulator